MLITVDIGNTCVKAGIFSPKGTRKVTSNSIPKGNQVSEEFIQNLIQWEALSKEEKSSPLSWYVAQTGSFSWKKIEAEIRQIRPQDRFRMLTHDHIPINIDADFPEKVGLDRLLAAVGAIDMYGDTPMLVVDAGTAITIDVVQNMTFCGGAILPGLGVMNESYPRISKKLPKVQFSREFIMKTATPGKNTEDAIRNGCYWGATATIRLFYEMFFTRRQKVLLLITGGDGEFLVPGLIRVLAGVQVAKQFKYHPALVLEGINVCAHYIGDHLAR